MLVRHKEGCRKGSPHKNLRIITVPSTPNVLVVVTAGPGSPTAPRAALPTSHVPCPRASLQVELRNPAVPSPSCPISHHISPTGAGFSPGTAPKPRGRCARSARLSVPFLPLLLTCPFNAFSHLGFKLASCCLRLLCRFASSLLGVGTIICLFFFPLLCYTYIRLKLILHLLSSSYAGVQLQFAAGFAMPKGMLTFMKYFHSPLIV